MIILITSLLITLYGLNIISTSFISSGNMNYKLINRFSVLFHLYNFNSKILYTSLILFNIIGAFIVSILSLSNYSNHFIISLDIIFYFTNLIIILFQSLKKERITSAI